MEWVRDSKRLRKIAIGSFMMGEEGGGHVAKNVRGLSLLKAALDWDSKETGPQSYKQKEPNSASAKIELGRGISFRTSREEFN